MCGVFGWINISNDIKYNYRLLKAATDSLSHRGPDSSGYWLKNNIALGHRRLSIIDLETGSQPMFSDKGNAVISNGEIYNYKELRNELITAKVVFKTNSDTEVLLNAYEVWGENFMQKLVGMFSFIIFDKLKNQILFARDRLGKKPLFYYLSNSLFAFSSEIKSLLILPEINKRISIEPHSISDYLSLGYILAPKTVFKNILKLSPGHYGIFSLTKNNLVLHKYWHLENFFEAKKILQPKNNITDSFMDKFQDSIKLRLRSDVGYGNYLSGGIDSSSVSLFARKFSNTKIDSFTMGFNEKSFDESKEAANAAEYLGVNYHATLYKPLTQTELSLLTWHIDEPLADTSIMPTYQLNKFAKGFVKVVLCGEGADETLAGYPTYTADKLYALYRYLPGYLKRWLHNFLSSSVKPSYKKLSWDYKIMKFTEANKLSPRQAHYWWRTMFSEKEKSQILNSDLLYQCKGYNPFDIFNNYFDQVKKAKFLDQTLFVDIKTWLQDDILLKADRMSMANSLEVRSPFLDHRLVEFTAMLPDKLKMKGFKQKVILKESMRKVLPKSILNKKKTGFNAPCLKNKIKIKHSQLLTDNFYLNCEKEDTTYKAFNILMLQIWLDIYENYRKTGNWTPLTYEE